MIELNIKGLNCIFDKEDFPLIMANNVAYARRNSDHTHLMFTSGKYAKKYVHRILLGVTDPNVIVDHINGNTLDNRKSNLRLSNKSNNAANMLANRTKESGLPKGVYREREAFKAQIKVRGIDMYLGHYKTIEEAEAVYKSRADAMFGQHASHNSRGETE